MLGMNQPTTTTSSAKSSLETSKQTKVSSAAPLSDPVVGPPGGTKTQDGRKGETELPQTETLCPQYISVFATILTELCNDIK